MTTLRRFLADRSAALAAMLILTQLLLGQAAASGFACARMDASAAAGVTVICVGDGFETRSVPAADPSEHDCCVDCPSAAGCGQSPALPAMADLASYAIAAGATDAVVAWTPSPAALGPRAPPPGLALQRGPPLLSV
ncbi:hypothetical protein H9Q09_08965 [Aurantimonas sp. DM33-3]|uniref:hypothetical protein n=1 Tax=Aurantimonas sp. DM33-3 TaxID=2766955 RepID=UPI001652A845|nr:hypothetical protein [Aurantimonas sp. DM33-3]MBC6716332.1 hypothetical protein [Aurantimonas sp. DM33-3]